MMNTINYGITQSLNEKQYYYCALHDCCITTLTLTFGTFDNMQDVQLHTKLSN